MLKPQDVLTFWFDETDQRNWFAKDEQFDQLIRQRFGVLHTAATMGELFQWRANPHGRLAEIVVLDQFSRNIYRDHAQAFAADSMALALAQEAVRCGDDQSLSAPEKSFLYMPFMHSESKLIHQQAVELFDQPGLKNNYKFELKHKAIIDRFGRYPYRNELLGRTSTPEELAFLKTPGSRF